MKTSTLFSVAMIVCFFMLHSSAFQIIGNNGPLIARRPCRIILPSSCLYSTPVQDITADADADTDTDTDTDAAIDTEVKFSATDFILSEISTHDVVVFSATYCPHCVQTKQLFERLGIEAKIIELDKIQNGLGPENDSVAVRLLSLTGQRTVPNIFVLGKHLGGNDQAHDAARSGALKQMLFNAL